MAGRTLLLLDNLAVQLYMVSRCRVGRAPATRRSFRARAGRHSEQGGLFALALCVLCWGRRRLYLLGALHRTAGVPLEG